MRFPLLALLLLSTAAPALAADPDSDAAAQAAEERSARAERSAPRFPRGERPVRPQPRFERPERPERAEPRFERSERQVAARAERPEPAAERPRPTFERIVRDVGRAERARPAGEPAARENARERRNRWSAPAAAPVPTGTQNEARPTDSVSGWRWRERNAERRGRQAEVPPAPPSPVLAQPLPAPDAAVRRADATRPPGGAGERRIHDVLRDRIAAEGWRKDWRRDRRYDWRRHRDRDRSRYHVGIYIDPFGWRYRNWDLGWRLPYRFYSSRYWINDPWHYRLPPVYGPYRWIRYYDDVLLVDLRTGRVVDRIRGFFW